MMQQFHQLLQQWKQGRPDLAGLQGPERGAAIQDWRALRPERPQMQPPGPQISPGPAPAPQVGQPQMGIAGLSRPPRGLGFGGSGLGQPGIMGRMRGAMGA